MKRISYAGVSVLTGDKIADAVLAYARVLANAQLAATISIPARLGDGAVGKVEILVGPASQIAAVPEDSDEHELIDGEVVSHLQAEIDNLSRPGASQAIHDPGWLRDFDAPYEEV